MTSVLPTVARHQNFVSVVMTVWNGEKLVAETIQSVLAQTFTDFELIIVDDGSTDRTADICESFGDPRIRVFRREHRGIVDSANFGISQARGRLVARIDADDLCLPERLQRQVEALYQHPEAVLCYTDVELFGDIAVLPTPARFVTHTGLIAIKLCFLCPLVHSTVLYRRDAFDRAGGYLPTTPVAEDYSLYTRLIIGGPFIGIPQKLVRFRRQEVSASTRHKELMSKIAGEIGRAYTAQFLQLDYLEAGKLVRNAWLPPAQRNIRDWLCFCWRCLQHRSSWHGQPLAWLLIQTARALRHKR